MVSLSLPHTMDLADQWKSAIKSLRESSTGAQACEVSSILSELRQVVLDVGFESVPQLLRTADAFSILRVAEEPQAEGTQRVPPPNRTVYWK